MENDPVKSAKQAKPEDAARRRRFRAWLCATFGGDPNADEFDGNRRAALEATGFNADGETNVSSSRFTQLYKAKYAFSEISALSAAEAWGLPRDKFLVDDPPPAKNTYVAQSGREGILIGYVLSIYRSLESSSGDAANLLFEMLEDIAGADAKTREKALLQAVGKVGSVISAERLAAAKAAGAASPSRERHQDRGKAPKAGPQPKRKRTAAR